MEVNFFMKESSFNRQRKFFCSFLTETFLCNYLNIIFLQCLFSILINIMYFLKFCNAVINV